MSSDAPLSPASEAARKKHFRETAYRDALEQASQEERAMLRADENLELWREALVSLLADLQHEFRDRKKIHNRAAHHANKEKTEEARQAFQKETEDYKQWKLTASAYKVDLDEKLSENKAARQQQHYRWNQSRDLLLERQDVNAITSNEERLLEDVERFLND